MLRTAALLTAGGDVDGPAACQRGRLGGSSRSEAWSSCLTLGARSWRLPERAAGCRGRCCWFPFLRAVFCAAAESASGEALLLGGTVRLLQVWSHFVTRSARSLSALLLSKDTLCSVCR